MRPKCLVMPNIAASSYHLHICAERMIFKNFKKKFLATNRTNVKLFVFHQIRTTIVIQIRYRAFYLSRLWKIEFHALFTNVK